MKGNISARVITQTNKAIAFLDASPLSLGHTLVIPKKHFPKIQDMDKLYSASLFELFRDAIGAIEAAAGTNASTVAIHNGVEAGQEIPHVHIHIIPRSRNDGAGPVHSMFGNRPKVDHERMDMMLHKIKLHLPDEKLG